jgi:hypothetical protein
MMTITDDNTAPPRVKRAPRVRVLSREEFIAKLRKDDPSANAETIRQRYEMHCRACIEDDQTLALVMPYVIEGLRRDVKDPKPATDRRAADAVKQQIAETLRKGFEEKVEAEATIRLLEWVTPYNRPLSDCTGAECKRLGRRLGSFFTELGNRLTPSETVGAHFPEAALQAIAKVHRLIGPRATR